MEMLGRRIAPVYLAYWTLGAVLIGILIGPLVLSSRDREQAALTQGDDHSIHFTHDHMMDHGQLEVPVEAAPSLSLLVIRDSKSGWNITIVTENFRFTPNSVNKDAIPNEGHAHVYVDGQKIARLYGPHFHLPELLPGTREIKVTLNANTHQTLALEGTSISAVVKIEQP